jgi:hypothetical protein
MKLGQTWNTRMELHLVIPKKFYCCWHLLWWPRLGVCVTVTTVPWQLALKATFRSLVPSLTSFPYLLCFPSRTLRNCNVLHIAGHFVIRPSISTMIRYTGCLFFVFLRTLAVTRYVGGFKLLRNKATTVRDVIF